MFKEKQPERFINITNDNMPSLMDITNSKYAAGKVYVEAASLYKRLDIGSKAKLKKIMENIRLKEEAPSSRGWSQEALQNRAEATQEWEDYLNLLADAYSAMLDALNEKDTWESAFESVRSINSMQKEMIKYNMGE